MKKEIHIVESRLTGKHSPETCEDGIVVTANHVAVIDGSTSKARQQMRQGMRNGRLAMLTISDVVRRLSLEATLSDFCREATSRIHDLYAACGLTDIRLTQHPEERATASVALYSLYHEEIWLIGDCQCIAEGNYHDNPKPEEESIAQRRSVILHNLLAEGKTDSKALLHHDIGRDAIVPDIVATCHTQNIDFAVVDGFPIALQKVKTIRTGTSDIILATDGYPFLLPTLDDSEKALSHQLDTDPLCIDTYKATKGVMEGNCSFDDRAYIRFRIK